MRFGSFVLALPLVALGAMPAFAQDVIFAAGTGNPIEYSRDTMSSSSSEVAAVAERVSDPVLRDGVATAVERVSESVMRLPVGRFADAIERARPGTVDRRLPLNATLGDVAGRDADYLPQELGERSREMMGVMGGFARALATMMPEVENMGREIEDSFRAAKAEARRNRD